QVRLRGSVHRVLRSHATGRAWRWHAGRAGEVEGQIRFCLPGRATALRHRAIFSVVFRYPRSTAPTDPLVLAVSQLLLRSAGARLRVNNWFGNYSLSQSDNTGSKPQREATVRGRS